MHSLSCRRGSTGIPIQSAGAASFNNYSEQYLRQMANCAKWRRVQMYIYIFFCSSYFLNDTNICAVYVTEIASDQILLVLTANIFPPFIIRRFFFLLRFQRPYQRLIQIIGRRARGGKKH